MLSQDALLGEDRPNRQASQLARARHFESNLASMEKDLTDAQATMLELTKDTKAFTPEQRKSMAEAVASFMDSSCTASTSTCKNQNHPYLHVYMTDTIWKQLRDKKIDWNDKKELFVDFAIEKLGLRYPNNDTCKLMLSIMWNAAEATMSPDTAYQELQSVHDMFVQKRLIINGRPLMAEYTRDASQFTKPYPHQFLECDPPIASQIDDRRLLQKMRKDVMPSRNTNKYLKDKTSNQTQAAGPSNLQSMFLQLMLGQLQSLPHTGASNSSSGSASRSRPPALTDEQLALTDTQPAEGHQQKPLALPPIPPAARESTPATVKDIVEQAKKVITAGRGKKTIKKGKGTTKAMKKLKKTPDDDDDEEMQEEENNNDEENEEPEEEHEEEEEDDEEEESEEETYDGDIAKKPATLIKRPAADVNKKPAADVHKKPAGNRPEPVFDEPLHWGGGRVYYSASKRAWRVYKRGTDKVESTVSVDAESAISIKTQWSKVLDAIEKDPRP